MVSHAANGGGASNSKSKTAANHNNRASDHSDSLWVRLLSRIFLYTFGFLNWLLFLFLALKSGKFFKKPTEKEQNDLAIARDRFWNLSKQPVSGLQHEFFKTRDGFQFHYLCNQLTGGSGRDLVILIHGFPNTCMTWRHLLKESALPVHDANFVVVDLPGFGGSDSMARYDTQVLEYMTEFIVGMRDKYGIDSDSVGSTFIVGHDWGCTIAMRLAEEAPCLADRFIFSNGVLIDLAKFNTERALTSSRSIFRQFQLSPRNNFGCVTKSYQAIKPLLVQLGYSGYIFAFQLPSMFTKMLGTGGNHSFLRAAYKAEHSTSRDQYSASESMAANLTPGLTECKSANVNGDRYGDSVVQRAKSVGETFWQTTAYYRHGLATDPWEKSIETVAALYNIDSDLSASNSPARRRSSSASSPLFADQAKGSLRAPATILWCEDDLALTKPICLDGIGDFLAKGSEVLLFPKGNHWIQVDKSTRATLAHVIALFARGDSKKTPSYIAQDVQAHDKSVTLMIRK